MPPHVNHIAATASSFHNATQSPLLQLLPLLPALQLLTLPRLPPAQPLSPLSPLLLLPLLPPLLLLPQLTLAMGICCAGPVACQAPTEVAQTAAALAKMRWPVFLRGPFPGAGMTWPCPCWEPRSQAQTSAQPDAWTGAARAGQLGACPGPSSGWTQAADAKQPQSAVSAVKP